jgi:hypothetical protein
MNARTGWITAQFKPACFVIRRSFTRFAAKLRRSINLGYTAYAVFIGNHLYVELACSRAVALVPLGKGETA